MIPEFHVKLSTILYLCLKLAKSALKSKTGHQVDSVRLVASLSLIACEGLLLKEFFRETLMPKDYELLVESRVQMTGIVQLLNGLLLFVQFLYQKK